jgi:hypothetical protein
LFELWLDEGPPLEYGEEVPHLEGDGYEGYPLAGEPDQQHGDENSQQAYLPPLEDVAHVQDHYEQGEAAGAYYDAAPAEEPLPTDYEAGQEQYGEQHYNYELPAGADSEAQPSAEVQYGEQPAAEQDPYSQYNLMPEEDMPVALTPPPAEPAAPAIDVDALLAGEREKHEQQLKMESAAREVRPAPCIAHSHWLHAAAWEVRPAPYIAHSHWLHACS